MKRTLLSFFLMLACLAGKAQSDEPINLVFIGNSITQGITLSDMANQNPCVQAGKVIEQQTGRTVVVKNHGHSGASTYNFQAPSSGWLNNAVNDAKALNGQPGPLFVSIMMGTNDSAERGPTGAPVSTTNYYNNMKGIIEYVLSNCSKAVVIVQYPIWYSPNTENSSLYGQAGLNRLKSYHPIIDDLVSYFSETQPGRVYAGSREPYYFFENKTQYFTPENGNQGTFYLHPNPTGAVKLGEFWAKSIISHLDNTTRQNAFVWSNPIHNGINSGGLRDCFVFRADGYWYLTGTSSPHWGEGYDNPGVRLYRSSNLTKWEEVGLIIKNPGTQKWYASRFWAPEIAYLKGRYYCTFNCRNERDGFDVKQSWGIAVADKVEGPYTVLSDDAPVARGNDASLFEDEDGRVYVSWCGASPEHPDGNVMTLAEINLETLELTNSHEIFGGTVGPRATTGWDECGVEGPYIFKRDGKYYMTYSSWQRGYEVGYATATDINGQWTKASNNPIFGAQSKSKWSGAVEGPWGDLGHNSIFTGPDGELWFSCHGQLRGENGPWLVIDRLQFDSKGNLKKIDVSYTEQIAGSFPMGWTYEAEDAEFVNESSTQEDIKTVKGTRYSGGLKVTNLGEGNSLMFDVSSSIPGIFDVVIDYISANVARDLEISVNGKYQTTVVCMRSSSTTPRSVTAQLVLEKGHNIIVMGNASGEAPDLDKMSVTYRSEIPSGIENVEGQTSLPKQEEVIYDLSGRRLNAVPRRGIFIRNNRKYIIK